MALFNAKMGGSSAPVIGFIADTDTPNFALTTASGTTGTGAGVIIYPGSYTSLSGTASTSINTVGKIFYKDGTSSTLPTATSITLPNDVSNVEAIIFRSGGNGTVTYNVTLS